MEINGYELTSEWKYSANGSFAKARKKGEAFFVKTLPSPRYPSKGLLSPEAFNRAEKACNEWFAERSDVIKDLNTAKRFCDDIVAPLELFREGPKYYVASQLISEDPILPKDICKCGDLEKYKLMRCFAEFLKAMEDIGMVHGDLKVDNVIVIRQDGILRPKFIDFEGCYRTGRPPKPETTSGSPEYYSPELGSYIVNNDADKGEHVTSKSDVFAAGLLFYEYWTGNAVETRCRYAYQVSNIKDLKLVGIPDDLKKLLCGMLEVDITRRLSADAVCTLLDSIIHGDGIKEGVCIRIEKKGTKHRFVFSDGTVRTVPSFIGADMAHKYEYEIPFIDLDEIDSELESESKSDSTKGATTIIFKNEKTVRFERDGITRSIPRALFDQMEKEGAL